jgi:hypothetical protein
MLPPRNQGYWTGLSTHSFAAGKGHLRKFETRALPPGKAKWQRMSRMKEVAWLAQVPLPGQRNPAQSNFFCVIAVSPGPGSSSTVSGREEGAREKERRSTQIRVPAPRMDSLSQTAASRASCSVQSVGKPKTRLPRGLSCILLLLVIRFI